MNLSKHKKTLTVLIVLAIIAISFFREFLFVNINYQLGKLYYAIHEPGYEYNYQLPSSIDFFRSFSYTQLEYTKYFLTVFFALLFLAISLLLIHLYFTNKKYKKYTFYAYFGVFTFSLFFYLVGFMIGEYEKTYRFARLFVGLIQSPFLLMILIPAFKISENNNS